MAVPRPAAGKAQPAEDRSETTGLKSLLWDKGWGVTVVALAVIAFHVVFPDVHLDNATIVLLIVAAWPLLRPWIRSIEFLGLKVELDEVKKQLGGVQQDLRRVHNEVTDGFETQTKQQDSVLTRVAHIESLLRFSGLPVSDERQERITQLVRPFLAYMRERGARFDVEPAVKIVPGTQFGQSVHYDPSTNQLVVGVGMIDEDDSILRECCFRVFHEPLADADVKRAVGELATSGRGFEVGSLIAGLRYYFVCSMNRAAPICRPGTAGSRSRTTGTLDLGPGAGAPRWRDPDGARPNSVTSLPSATGGPTSCGALARWLAVRRWTR